MVRALCALILTIQLVVIFPDLLHAQSEVPAHQDVEEEIKVKSLIDHFLGAINANSVEVMMQFCSHSPNLIFSEDDQITIGWDAVRSLLQRRYGNRSTAPTRMVEKIVIRKTGPDLAVAIVWWSDQHPVSGEHGTWTLMCMKTDDSWSIISASTIRR